MSELEAGRELDALVAEKVMGRAFSSTLPQWQELPKPYSTDIGAAWEVVEKIFHEKGWSLWPLSDAKNIEDDSPPWYATGWGVYTSSGIDLWDDEIAIAETAPLAICRAALKAVGA